MALSMDEQRMLAEIERRLSAEDPGLAARLSSFKRPGPAAKLRTPRGRIIGSLATVALLAVISLMVYAMIPFRAHGPKSTLTTQTATRPGISAPANPVKLEPLPSSAPRTNAAARPSTANSAAIKATTSKTVASKAAASKTTARTRTSTHTPSTASATTLAATHAS